MDALSLTFAALADPTRRAILARLRGGEASVTELTAPFRMSMPAVSRHLKVLETAGLISRGRQAQWRPCRIEAAQFKEISGWLQEFRSLWTGSPDRLAANAGVSTAAEAVGDRPLKRRRPAPQTIVKSVQKTEGKKRERKKREKKRVDKKKKK